MLNWCQTSYTTIILVLDWSLTSYITITLELDWSLTSYINNKIGVTLMLDQRHTKNSIGVGVVQKYISLRSAKHPVSSSFFILSGKWINTWIHYRRQSPLAISLSSVKLKILLLLWCRRPLSIFVKICVFSFVSLHSTNLKLFLLFVLGLACLV